MAIDPFSAQQTLDRISRPCVTKRFLNGFMDPPFPIEQFLYPILVPDAVDISVSKYSVSDTWLLDTIRDWPDTMD
ncbi:hypothetical protein TrVGV298_005778 [Trichoderma virens]|nr:hypothetical protein TrVGV298_005778 [Trichoderma virens]